MIAGIFHSGSGVGNQLHRYVATKVLALDKGYDFGMVAPDLCKVKDFMSLDMGKVTGICYESKLPEGKTLPFECSFKAKLPVWEEKTNYYNPEFNFIEDITIIDGEFQDERYFEHRLQEIDKWLRVEPINIPGDVCVIGFRGGEFYTVPELGLPKEYFDEGVRKMLEINPNMKFEVHTDDLLGARNFFGWNDLKIIHDVGINWRSMRYAKYAIIANSSFYILPRLLKHHDWPDTTVTIAPRYWDRYNIKKWERPYNYYKKFTYV